MRTASSNIFNGAGQFAINMFAINMYLCDKYIYGISCVGTALSNIYGGASQFAKFGKANLQ